MPLVDRKFKSQKIDEEKLKASDRTENSKSNEKCTKSEASLWNDVTF